MNPIARTFALLAALVLSACQSPRTTVHLDPGFDSSATHVVAVYPGDSEYRELRKGRAVKRSAAKEPATELARLLEPRFDTIAAFDVSSRSNWETLDTELSRNWQPNVDASDAALRDAKTRGAGVVVVVDETIEETQKTAKKFGSIAILVEVCGLDVGTNDILFSCSSSAEFFVDHPWKVGVGSTHEARVKVAGDVVQVLGEELDRARRN